MQTILIKFGGSLFTNEHSREKFWNDIKTLTQQNFKVVIVHGGGKEISKWLEKINANVKFVNGLRYTDKEIMTVVEMVLSGSVNKQLTTELANLGVDCLGLSSRDNNLIIAETIKELGLAGEPVKTNIAILQKLLNLNIVPIISPVSNDENGSPVNVNADSSANALAIALKVDSLVFMTDTTGVLENIQDQNSVIHSLNSEKAKKLIADGIINGGMIPKIESAFNAIKQGVKSVNIIDGREFGIIESIFIKNEKKGTTLI